MITRGHMRRQLRASGGITNARQGYGIGSWVKERFRKIIPNELASVATKAAPFVAPFFPGAAAAMRGIGRFDQRGSISDAMKQAGATYGFGKAANYGLSKIRTGAGGSLATGNAANTTATAASQKQVGTKLLGDLSKKIPNIPGLGSMGELAKQQLLMGSITGGISYIYEKFMKEEPEQQQGESYGEYLARRKKNVASKMRQYKDNYLAFDKDWSAMDDEAKNKQIQSELTEYDVEDANMNQGGRVGYANGSDDMILPMEKPQVEKFLTREEAEARNPAMFVDTTTSNPIPDNAAELAIAELAKVIMGTRGSDKNFMQNKYLIPKVKEISENYGYSEAEILKMIKDQMMTYSKPKMNKGGIMRLNYMIGGEAKQMEAGAPPIMYSGNMDPNAQTGLPSIPGPMQMAEDGPEFDMRQQGGFQPLGRQEGKDDVPAMLAKNEFVMTADAVRAAGGGSIQKGAQKMYNTMKKLESRVS